MKAKFAKLVEFLYRNRLTPLALNIPTAILLALAAFASAMTGHPVQACINAFFGGWVFANILQLLSHPYRLRDYTDEQAEHYKRQFEQIIAETIAEAKRHGVIPEGVEITPPTKLN